MRILKLPKYCLWAAVFIPLTGAFFLLERTVAPKYTVSCALDYYIPFVPVFAVFYFVWFAYMAVAMAFFMLTSKRDFLRLTAFLAAGMLSCFVVYAIFPNAQPLRPETVGGGIFGALVSWLYSIDTPTNVCPSIHVINTIGVHACICKSERFSNERAVKGLSFIIMLLINLSTMLIKQHSVIDVIAGTVFAGVIYYVIFHVYEKGA